jgi:hypothetical protein
VEILVSACLGFGLAAATGLRVFIPLLALALAARADAVTLIPSLDWIDSTGALVVFVVAAAVEVAGYLIPVVDNLLDTVATPAAMVAGTVVMASVLVDLDPLWAWSLAVIAGGGAAAAVQGTTVVARAASTATTAGGVNPALATGEALGSAGLSALSIALPVLAAMAVIGLLAVAAWKVPRLYRRLFGSRAH